MEKEATDILLDQGIQLEIPESFDERQKEEVVEKALKINPESLVKDIDKVWSEGFGEHLSATSEQQLLTTIKGVQSWAKKIQTDPKSASNQLYYRLAVKAFIGGLDDAKQRVVHERAKQKHSGIRETKAVLKKEKLVTNMFIGPEGTVLDDYVKSEGGWDNYINKGLDGIIRALRTTSTKLGIPSKEQLLTFDTIFFADGLFSCVFR